MTALSHSLPQAEPFRPNPGDRRCRAQFCSLWRALLMSLLPLGSDILPTDRSMGFFLRLYDVYGEDPKKGVVLLFPRPEPKAVLMWGEIYVPWDSTMGKIAQGWGTYVSPELRRRGVAGQLRLAAANHLREAGFDTVLGAASLGNKPGFESGIHDGFKPVQTVCAWDLREEDF